MNQGILTQFLTDVRSQVKPDTPAGVVEQIAKQMVRNIEAGKRIEEEGIVVRDMKGSVISHPAIKIEIDSGKIISDLLFKHKADVIYYESEYESE